MFCKEKYAINSNEKFGRYMVAVCDIQPGEVILKEPPVTIGPKARSGLICLDCLRPIKNNFDCCKKCHIATLCRNGCIENFFRGHSVEECETFAKISNWLSALKLVENFDAIAPLRCLLLKRQQDQTDWNRFIGLESHIDKRRDHDIWKFNENINKFLQSHDLLQEDEIKEDLVQKICGILDVNCFELRSPTISAIIPRSDSLRGVFVMAAIMSHNCAANTHVAINDNYEMTVHASAPIKKGEIISYNYTNPLLGTFQRQRHLMEGKYFRCDCPRCLDSTELGLYISSILCPRCRHGNVSILDARSKTYYKSLDAWGCENCLHKYEGSLILQAITQLKDKFEDIDKSDIKEVDKFISLAAKTLTPNHYILIEARQCLAGLLRDLVNRDINIPKWVINKKSQLCKGLLKVLVSIEPGISRLKAITLYELYLSEAQIAQRDYEAREIPLKDFLSKLQLAEELLKQALHSLIFEPKSSPEGMLCRRAMEELKMLRSSILSMSVKSKDEIL